MTGDKKEAQQILNGTWQDEEGERRFTINGSKIIGEDGLGKVFTIEWWEELEKWKVNSDYFADNNLFIVVLKEDRLEMFGFNKPFSKEQKTTRLLNPDNTYFFYRSN